MISDSYPLFFCLLNCVIWKHFIPKLAGLEWSITFCNSCCEFTPRVTISFSSLILKEGTIPQFQLQCVIDYITRIFSLLQSASKFFIQTSMTNELFCVLSFTFVYNRKICRRSGSGVIFPSGNPDTAIPSPTPALPTNRLSTPRSQCLLDLI